MCLGEKVAWTAGTALKCRSCVSVLTKLQVMMCGSPLFKLVSAGVGRGQGLLAREVVLTCLNSSRALVS